jgi:divalent metal cation (Fe/Co/Zn/Cd) transporter
MMHETSHVTGVSEVTGIRARWVGHRMNADVSFAVPPEASVESAHTVSVAVQQRLKQRWPQLTLVTTQVIPANSNTKCPTQAKP